MFNRTRLTFAIAAAALLSLSFAQEPYETGSIEATIAGKEIRAWTYATDIPANVADGVEDERQRAFLERVAGTTVHSASFMHREAMMLGGMVLVEETIYVTLSTRTDHPEGNSFDSLLVEFSLAPETLELGEEVDIKVTYYPSGSSYDDYYALTDGSLLIESLEVLDDQTMAISGTISGLLSHQSDYDIMHNPADTLEIEARFEISQVKTSDTAYSLITGD